MQSLAWVKDLKDWQVHSGSVCTEIPFILREEMSFAWEGNAYCNEIETSFNSEIANLPFWAHFDTTQGHSYKWTWVSPWIQFKMTVGCFSLPFLTACGDRSENCSTLGAFSLPIWNLKHKISPWLTVSHLLFIDCRWQIPGKEGLKAHQPGTILPCPSFIWREKHLLSGKGGNGVVGKKQTITLAPQNLFTWAPHVESPHHWWQLPPLLPPWRWWVEGGKHMPSLWIYMPLPMCWRQGNMFVWKSLWSFRGKV